MTLTATRIWQLAAILMGALIVSLAILLWKVEERVVSLEASRATQEDLNLFQADRVSMLRTQAAAQKDGLDLDPGDTIIEDMPRGTPDVTSRDLMNEAVPDIEEPAPVPMPAPKKK